jgi:hypothetical protein
LAAGLLFPQFLAELFSPEMFNIEQIYRAFWSKLPGVDFLGFRGVEGVQTNNRFTNFA